LAIHKDRVLFSCNKFNLGAVLITEALKEVQGDPGPVKID